jgi:caffeoyl-CoA O-methyltransferase
MFNAIPIAILDRMRHLERIDARDRLDGTLKLERLRQIPPETGRLLAILAACAPVGQFLEVGTSAGYSTLWLSLACRQRGVRVTTFELLPGKAKLAEETFRRSGTADIIQVVQGDARKYLPDYKQVAFCFIDSEKDLYEPIYGVVIPHMVPGGLFVADNAVSHADELAPFLNRVNDDGRVDSVILPIGKGVLLCRKSGKHER